MKKTLSIILAVAMLVSCFAFSTSAMAADLPEMKIGSSTKVTIPAKGDFDKLTDLATFTPEKSGYYVFYATTDYSNESAEKDVPPVGVADLVLKGKTSEEDVHVGFFTAFSDVSKLSEKALEELKKDPTYRDNLEKIMFTANLEAGKKYTLVAAQDGIKDFTTEFKVETHTHTIKKNVEKKVEVRKDGTASSGGLFNICSDWFCVYEETVKEYPGLSTVCFDKTKYTYTGKKLKPTINVEDEYGKKLNKKYYTVTYKNNKKIGTATAIVKFSGIYTGTVKKTFKIVPKKTAIKNVKAGKKQLKVTYKKVKGVTGYQIQTATNKSFKKNAKAVTVKGAKKTSKAVKKLKSGKKYYVRVRAYKTVNGKKYYSSWSKVKSVKVK